jgi:sulfite reductase (ferredoxin)
VPLEEVPDVWVGIARLFRDHGYRRLRNRARLKYLVEDWGTERFRQVLEDDYLPAPLLDGPAPATPKQPLDHVGVHPQLDGRWSVGVAPAVGRVSGTTLSALAELAETHGRRRIRTTPLQKLVVLDVPGEHVDALVAGLDALGLPARPSPFRRTTMACTGIEFCKLAIVETKGLAAATVAELEDRLADLEPVLREAPVSLHVNGCPNSCARIQVADIGLKGQVMTGPDGAQVDGFQVHLGGGLGLDAGFGRKVRGHKVTAAELPAFVERLVRRFAAQRHDGERFAQWVARAADEDLR